MIIKEYMDREGIWIKKDTIDIITNMWNHKHLAIPDHIRKQILFEITIVLPDHLYEKFMKLVTSNDCSENEVMSQAIALYAKLYPLIRDGEIRFGKNYKVSSDVNIRIVRKKSK